MPVTVLTDAVWAGAIPVLVVADAVQRLPLQRVAGGESGALGTAVGQRHA